MISTQALVYGAIALVVGAVVALISTLSDPVNIGVTIVGFAIMGFGHVVLIYPDTFYALQRYFRHMFIHRD